MNFKKTFFPAFAEKAPVETKLFEITLLLSNVILYFWTIFGFFFGYEWPTQFVYLSAAVIYTAFYMAYLKWSVNQSLVIAYYFAALGLLALAWLPSGGILGAISNMFVLVFVSALLVLSLKGFKKVVYASILLFIGFTVFEISNPGVAAAYLDHKKWLIDVTVSQLVMLLILAVTLFFYKKEYAKDRESLKSSNKFLAQEKVKAEASEKVKGAFLSSVSHEIRTPLNGILGNLELLQSTNLNDEQQQFVKDLNHSSDMLHGLISDLLDVAMIDETGILLQENHIDLQQIITNVVQFFIPKVALKTSNVSIHFKHDATIPKNLLGDMTRTRQVLINLINNAVKFTDEGSVVITSKLVRLSDENALVRVIVKDTGSGVPLDMRQTIFDSFQRTTNLGVNGMGLGLSVCKKVIDTMGGEIGLKETSENGSEFYFEVPFKLNLFSKHGTSSGNTNRYSKLSVLIAEDQQVNQLVVRKMLKNLGVKNITMVEDGQRAVEQALIGNYDFILMDLRMPKKDGIQAALEILDLLKSHPPVILALTANATYLEMENCLDAGMKDFITKPLTMEVLESSINKFMI